MKVEQNESGKGAYLEEGRIRQKYLRNFDEFFLSNKNGYLGLNYRVKVEYFQVSSITEETSTFSITFSILILALKKESKSGFS